MSRRFVHIVYESQNPKSDLNYLELKVKFVLCVLNIHETWIFVQDCCCW